jgi:hypothetical protein
MDDSNHRLSGLNLRVSNRRPAGNGATDGILQDMYLVHVCHDLRTSQGRIWVLRRGRDSGIDHIYLWSR